MSAYVGDPTKPRILSINRDPETPAWGLSAIEHFLAAARQVESALQQERALNRRLNEELQQVRQSSERELRDQELKIREISSEDAKLRIAVAELQAREGKSTERLHSLELEYKKVRGELQHYRNAWSEVLQREREAKMIIADSRDTRSRLVEAERATANLTQTLAQEKQRAEQAERHSESYQKELQNALVRLHSSESRFNEIFKELQILSESKRSMDLEIERAENSMRERFQWELARERERIKAETVRESAEQAAQLRQEFELRQAALLQAAAAAERAKHLPVQEALAAEVDVLKKALSEATDEASRSRLELRVAKQAIDGLSALHDQLRAQLSGVKRELAELMPLEAETTRLQAEILAANQELASVRQRQTDLQAELGIFESALIEQSEKVQEAERLALIQVKTADDRARDLVAEVLEADLTTPLRQILSELETEMELVRRDLSLLHRADYRSKQLRDKLELLEGEHCRLQMGLSSQEARMTSYAKKTQELLAQSYLEATAPEFPSDAPTL